MLRVRERLKVVVPITVFLIFLLLYMNTKSTLKATIVMLAVPFSAIGAVWYLWILGYNVSIAVWVGMIALMGLDAETGVFMLLFLDLSYNDAVRKGRHENVEGFRRGHYSRRGQTGSAQSHDRDGRHDGPFPIMWSVGTGSDMMKRVAAPMIGGLVTSFLLELLVYPPLYFIWKKRDLKEV
jgi:Cu(I)/Ag(I) efflux system membrane protein CusA/SilA